MSSRAVLCRVMPRREHDAGQALEIGERFQSVSSNAWRDSIVKIRSDVNLVTFARRVRT